MAEKKRGLPKGRTNNPDGRPPVRDHPTRITVTVGTKTLGALDARASKDGVSRAEAARQALERGLGVKES